MIRNHPSLALYCGGNEIGPPEDLIDIIHDTLSSSLDGTRLFVESSTSEKISYNVKGGTGDGPYSIQPLSVFWEERTFPFNSEIGSVGMGDYESLKRFIPDTSMIIPGQYQGNVNETGGRWRNIEPVWRYHKFIGYREFIGKYGVPDDVEEFADIAQLVNYNQYRALAEGFSSHMWEWYTGFIIWKTQNPWTALRGQMYDYFLDPNGGLYGLHHGSEPVHIMCDPTNGMILVVNNRFEKLRNLMVLVKSFDVNGQEKTLYQQLVDVEPVSVKHCQSISRGIGSISKEKGIFLSMKLMESESKVISENVYWLPDSIGNFPFLKELPEAEIGIRTEKRGEGKLHVRLSNPAGNPLAFFIRLSIIDRQTRERILPVFYSDNYLSIEPGDSQTVELEYNEDLPLSNLLLHVRGWNVNDWYIDLK
jgi:hypothetical protein